jgi:hypothetical protein
VLRFFRKSKRGGRAGAEVGRFLRKREKSWNFLDFVGKIGPGIFFKREKYFRIFS